MNKILFGAMVSVFAIAGANAVTVQPYASAKVAYGWTNIADSKISETTNNGIPSAAGTNETDNYFGGKIAAGAKIGLIRAEAEFGFEDQRKFKIVNKDAVNEFFDAKLNTLTYFINAYYDIETDTKLSPYIGAGLGWAHVKSSASYKYATGEIIGDNSSDEFAWNVGAGLAYALCDNLSIDLGYRYTNLGEVKGKLSDAPYEFKSTSKIDSHEILLGARYSF